MIWDVSRLEALGKIDGPTNTVVYVFVSLSGEPSNHDRGLLDEGEAERARRFHRSTDRDRFTLAHAALRVVLARFLGLRPAEIEYESGRHGKPRLRRDPIPLQFSLSHSGDLGLIAVSRECEVGVDIEQVRLIADVLDITESHFSRGERDALQSLPESKRGDGFFRCWTRKEAVVKALGEGLGFALDSFDVDIRTLSPAALRIESRFGVESRLSLRDLPTPPGYVAAGAALDPYDRLGWSELSELRSP